MLCSPSEIEALRLENMRLKEALFGSQELPPQLGLTVRQERVLRTLLQRKYASIDLLMTAIYYDAPGDEAQPEIIKTYVYSIRRKLPQIEIKTAWGRGYWMPEEAKIALRSLIESGCVATPARAA